MNSFRQENLDHIKDRFQTQTGVALTPARANRRPLRVAVVLAAAAALFTITAWAAGLFSSFDGDSLVLFAAYEGDGIVAVQAENRSDKDLSLEPQLKLMLFKDGVDTEIEPLADAVIFSDTHIPAHSTQTIRVDLSQAYDMEQLEIHPRTGYYYFILTNSKFALGQRWTCTVQFRRLENHKPLPEPTVDKAVQSEILEPLQPYFEISTLDPFERWTQGHEYLELVQHLLSQVDGNVVPAVEPYPRLIVGNGDTDVIFDPSIPTDRQFYELTGEHRHVMDGYFKVLGSSEHESALVISAYVPFEKGNDAQTDIPLLYIFSYEADAIQSPQDYAFIRGRLLTFEQLEQYKVYEDEQYVSYEVSELFYTDLRQHVENYMAYHLYDDFELNEQTWNRIRNIYNYYKENLPNLFYYLQPAA